MPVYVLSLRWTLLIDQTTVQLEPAAMLLTPDQKSPTLQSCDAVETHYRVRFFESGAVLMLRPQALSPVTCNSFCSDCESSMDFILCGMSNMTEMFWSSSNKVDEQGMSLSLLSWLLRQTDTSAADSQMLHEKRSLSCLFQQKKSFLLLKSTFPKVGNTFMSETGLQCQAATVL